jgi:ribosomal protein S18 acetylase RimI-like enzyme
MPAQSEPILVRSATVDDLTAITRIHARAFAARDEVPRSFVARLEEPGREAIWKPRLPAVVVAEDRGFAWFGHAEGIPDAGELYLICVDPDYQRQGVGRALLEATVERLRARGRQEAVLWTAAANEPARRFYAANGWRPDGATEEQLHTGVPMPSLRYRRRLS